MEPQNEATLKRRGSGVSIALSKSPSRVGTRPNSLERTAVQEYQDWQTGYPQPAGPYPILVNPPPMPTVKTNESRLIKMHVMSYLTILINRPY
jgi:hypothetical protein